MPNLHSRPCFIRAIPNGAPLEYGDSAGALAVFGQDEGFESGFTAWPWSPGAGWVPTSSPYRGGGAAMYPGGADSGLQVTLTFDAAGFIGFFYRKTGAADYFRFYIDGVEQWANSVASPWASIQVPVSSGTHTLRWLYDDTGSGSSAVHLDAIGFAPLLELAEPSPGVIWDIGSLQTIRWTNTLAAGPTVALSYRSDATAPWQSITAAATNSGEYAWVVGPVPGTNAILRVVGSRAASDDTLIPITIRGMQWVYPNGGQALRIGTNIVLRWDSAAVAASDVRLECSTDGKASWKPIEASTPNDGAHAWTIPNEETDRAWFRVTSLGATQFADVSDAACIFYAEYDLVVASLTVTPSRINLGEQVTLSVTVSNRGWNNIAFPFFTGGWQDMDHPPMPGEQEEYYWALSQGLASGSTKTFSTTVRPASAGWKQARALVDCLNWVPESDEANNTAAANYLVRAQPLHLTISRVTGAADIALEWPSMTNLTYTVWCSTNLPAAGTTGAWFILRAHLPATPSPNRFRDPAPVEGRRFYRVEEE